MNKEPRITIEALQFYVPLFQKGDDALNRLYDETLSPAEKNRLESIAQLRELSAKRIEDLARPLIVTEISKIVDTSYLKEGEELFNLLYYAGINGMIKGLRKFDVEKINKSSTNYLFQWLTTYAKRELLIQEAPFNIAPSRFGIYKKIGAVRQRLAGLLERQPSNEEVYNFFQSGEADIKTLNGPVVKRKISKANKSIRLDIIEEQYEFEQKYNYMFLIDPVDDYKLPDEDSSIFEETVFGIFLNKYNFTTEARTVLKSYLNFDDEYVGSLSSTEFNRGERMWKKLLKDINGPFYSFLIELDLDGFTEFDIKSIIKEIEQSKVKIKSSEYEELFKGEKIVKY